MYCIHVCFPMDTVWAAICFGDCRGCIDRLQYFFPKSKQCINKAMHDPFRHAL